MATEGEETNGQQKEQQQELGSTGSGSAGPLGCLSKQGDALSMDKAGGTQNSATNYGKPLPQTLATAKGPDTQQHSSDATARAETVKVSSSGESTNSCPDPPVTKATLSELDVPRIVFNPKLRHDVNFDPDLHFRPNLDGDSGRRKAQKATEFWNCLAAQLGAFMQDPFAFERDLPTREWCLPLTLRAISEILSTLVPLEDRSSVEEILNVEHLMQQFRKGVADLEKLASWLSRTLKSHCAPMRDDWVDEMSKALSIGNSTRDVSKIVQGLQTLLGVLEAMKLDVANHQIRCLRLLLIQDTVEFEQTFFLKKIASRKIDVGAAQAWFNAAKLSAQDTQVQSSKLEGNLWAFFYGFASMLLPSKSGPKIPDTFIFDEERIMKLRSDMLDAVNLDVCIRLLRRTRAVPCLCADSASRNHGPSTGHNDTALCTLRNIDKKVLSEPRQSSIQNSSERSPVSSDGELEEEELDAGSLPTSRTSSFSSTISAPPVFPLSRSIASSSLRDEEILAQSILDIIDDTSGNNRWQQSCPAIALELARSTNLNNLSTFESQLRDYITNPSNPIFQTSESNVLAELTPLLSDMASRYLPLTSTKLFEVTTSPKPLPGQLPKPRQALADVAKHSAHIGTLHWRVWAPLVYLVDPDVATGSQQVSNIVGDVKGRESRNTGQACGPESIAPETTPPGFAV